MSRINENNHKALSELKPGETFKVQKVLAKGEIRRRLVDIGFIKEEPGKVLREALFRDPIEIEIKQSKVSLRRSEAELIKVKVID